MIWFNNRLLPSTEGEPLLPITDRSFLLGEGLFETLLTNSSHALALDRHLCRLLAGATVLGVAAPTSGFLASAVNSLLASTPEISLGRLRITLTGSGALLITHHPYREWSEPAHLVTYPHSFNQGSPLQAVKSTSYGEYLMALKYARERGADDALIFNIHDQVMEASTANIAAYLGGRWVTPPLTAGPLPGITRALMLEWGAIIEQEIRFEELIRSESAVLLSSLRGVQPVAQINGRNMKVGDRSTAIATFYKEALAGNLNP